MINRKKSTKNDNFDFNWTNKTITFDTNLVYGYQIMVLHRNNIFRSPGTCKGDFLLFEHVFDENSTFGRCRFLDN